MICIYLQDKPYGFESLAVYRNDKRILFIYLFIILNSLQALVKEQIKETKRKRIKKKVTKEKRSRTLLRTSGR